MLTIPQLTEKMIAFSAGNTADIHHFLCVWAYAKTIGEAEGLDEKTLFLLEATAIIHDISCPLCREKYGNTDGKHHFLVNAAEKGLGKEAVAHFLENVAKTDCGRRLLQSIFLDK